ncbi:response regulator transcription factor [Paraburkholderia metrosideri]|jgi:DNA-binding response OmpR family regulator|uniref:Sensory transduction protein regX3 n=1 Tax=Paraburkholderia metrosideri TaxID=580937 RepID=A0ABM8P5G4_9BURK|nr:response regulator transcription factor [Paraburkholderia metrosideri]CAD6556845.1 Sensory transduction protein regX3 [Paraburkholderia metrosideri]
MTRILLVEDDEAHSSAVDKSLQSSGHEISRVGDGEKAVEFLTENLVDLIILDWNLPKMSGLDVLHWIRAHLGGGPGVLFLTSKLLEVDIVTALEAGADDYVAKPFRLVELSARVNALLRRSKRDDASQRILRVADYVLDLNERSVLFGGKNIGLTAREFELAACLFGNLGRIISRDLLAKIAWGREHEIASRTIDTHIYRIRGKLQLNPKNGLRLSTVYTRGYRLDEVVATDVVGDVDG